MLSNVLGYSCISYEKFENLDSLLHPFACKIIEHKGCNGTIHCHIFIPLDYYCNRPYILFVFKNIFKECIYKSFYMSCIKSKHILLRDNGVWSYENI